MQNLASSLSNHLWRFKSDHTKDETVPFANYDQNDPEVEAQKEEDENLNENKPPLNLPEFDSEKKEKRRRDTVTGIEKPTISAWDAGWNVSNAIQGMFVLGLPMGIRYGGYFGLLMITVSAVLCYYTGKILIKCLYEVKNDKRTRVRGSYADVAVDCWGKVGSHVVNLAQLIELLMTCVLYIVVSGNLMSSSFPHVPISEAGWSVISSLSLFLCVLLRDLKAVSRLSMGCSVVQIVVMAITMFYCLLDISDWNWSKLTFSVDGKKFPVSIGVIVFSYTSQIFLPSLEGSMEQRKEFRKMLCWSYVASCAMKELFALFCFLTWADETKEVVTDNLPYLLRAIMNVMLVVKALLSYPLPYYQSLEIIEQSLFTDVSGGWGTFFRTKRHPYNSFTEKDTVYIQHTSFIDKNSPLSSSDEEKSLSHSTSLEKTILVNLNDPPQQSSSGCPSCYNADGDVQMWALALRAILVLGTLIMAVYIPHFGLLMGFTGSLTGTLLAFLLPCAFHLQLKWKDMSWADVVLDVVIFLFGLFCAFSGLYYSLIGLYEAFHPSSNVTFSFLGNLTTNEGGTEVWMPDFLAKTKD